MGIFISSNCKKKINWQFTHTNLSNLQNRIVKQIQKKNYRNVRNLQRLILKKFSSRLLVSQKIIETTNVKKFNLYKISQNNPFLPVSYTHLRAHETRR